MRGNDRAPTLADAHQYDPALAEALLTIPTYRRGNWQATAYVARSPKLGVELTVLGHERYALWLILEANPKVTRFSLDPTLKVTASEGDETTVYRPLGGAILGDQLCIYVSPGKAPSPCVTSWCSDHEIKVITPDATELSLDSVVAENRKRIIAFLNLAEQDLTAPLFEELRILVRAQERLTVGEIIKRCPTIDQTVVLAAIGQMIFNGSMVAEIERLPFDRMLSVRV